MEETSEFEHYINTPIMSPFERTFFSNVLEKLGWEKFFETFTIDLKTKLIFKGESLKTLRTRYHSIRVNCIHMYNVYKSTNPEEVNDLTRIIRGLYELDNLCGIANELHHGYSLGGEEYKRALSLMDEDQLKFKEIFQRNYKLLEKEVSKKLFFEFGILIFKFNGYQPPIRTNPMDALKDSYGINDFCKEFLNSIIS